MGIPIIPYFLKLFVEKNENVSRLAGKISSHKLSECLQILTLKSSCLPDLKLISECEHNKVVFAQLFGEDCINQDFKGNFKSRLLQSIWSIKERNDWKFTCGLFFNLESHVLFQKRCNLQDRCYLLFFFPLPLNQQCPELQFRIISKFYKSFCKIQAKMDVNPRTNFPQHKSWSPSKMRRPYDDDKLPLISRSVEGTLLCAGILRGHRLPHFNDPKTPE